MKLFKYKFVSLPQNALIIFERQFAGWSFGMSAAAQTRCIIFMNSLNEHLHSSSSESFLLVDSSEDVSIIQSEQMSISNIFSQRTIFPVLPMMFPRVILHRLFVKKIAFHAMVFELPLFAPYGQQTIMVTLIGCVNTVVMKPGHPIDMHAIN